VSKQTTATHQGHHGDNFLTHSCRSRWTKHQTKYKYDAVGNLTNVVYPVSPSISLSYDVLNRLTSMVDGVGTTHYSYDQVGQLLSAGGLWPDDTVNYAYANRLRMGMSVSAPNSSAWTHSYGYDSMRRLTNVVSPAGIFAYTYDPVQLQRVDELSLPDGAVITNTYDLVARQTLTELLNSEETNLDSYAYGYNQANERTNVVRTAGDHVNYTYDNEGELTALSSSEAGGTARSFENNSYSYDAAGNLLTKQLTIYARTSFALNQLNQITNATLLSGPGGLIKTRVSGSTTSPATNVAVNGVNAILYADKTFAANPNPTVVSGLNTFTAIAQDVYGRWSTNVSTVNVIPTNNSYSYDLNGNLLTDGTRYFAYDDENELISVMVANTWSNNFVYDGKMRRRIERDYSWSGSSWAETNEVHFIYDGNVVVQERAANNLPTVTYTRGNDLSGTLQGAGGIGGLLARTDMGQWVIGSAFAHTFYHADGNGNVTCLIYTNQMIAAKYLYDPFGNTLAQYGSLANANTYRFSSKEWNTGTGLYYYLYRFYDPNLQRWPNRDPIMDWGSTVFDSMRKQITRRVYQKEQRKPNAFIFVENTPLLKVDAFGLQSWMGPGYGSFGPGGVNGSGNPGQPGCYPPCPAGQSLKPYWQIMGYESESSCATAEWQLNRDGIAGGLGIIGGTIIGGWPGGVIGGVGAGILIPNAICNQQICN